MRLRNFFSFVCGLICLICLLAGLLLIISDKGAELTRDGMPLTSAATYGFLLSGAVFSGAAALLIGRKAPQKQN